MAAPIPLVVLVIACASVAWAQSPAQTERLPIRAAFEGDQVRVLRVSLDPGASVGSSDHPDALLVPLTADLDGRVPRDEVAWYSAGTATFENRARTRFEGILVELAERRFEMAAPLPPEVIASRIPEYRLLYGWEDQRPRVRTVVDNPRVLVTWHRLPAWQVQTEPWHFHPSQLILVYLSGGEIGGSAGHLGVRRVRRGDFDVLPANALHAFRNTGNDPIEFLMIAPK